MNKLLSTIALLLSTITVTAHAERGGPKNSFTIQVPVTQNCAPTKDFNEYLEKGNYVRSGIAVVDGSDEKMLLTTWANTVEGVRKVTFILSTVNAEGVMMSCVVFSASDIGGIDQEPLMTPEL